MSCPRIQVVSEPGSSDSLFFISFNAAVKAFEAGRLRENLDADGNVIPDTAVAVPVDEREELFVARGYDQTPCGRDSGPHTFSVAVPAYFDIQDCYGLFGSDIMPCHPARWGLSSQ
jgi:hypothetical protein